MTNDTKKNKTQDNTMNYLSPRNDIAFKKIFGEAGNKDILIHFLNDILHKTGTNAIVEVSILNPQQLPEISVSKQSILDVLCEDSNKVKYLKELIYK